LKKWLLRQTQHEYPAAVRWPALVVAGGIFLIVIPLLLIWFGRRIDSWLGLSLQVIQSCSWLIGGLLIGAGLPLALWTVITQGTIGRGTPIPIMAPQKLIIVPPYTICRNPMALGTIMAYLGVGVLGLSAGAVLLAVLFAVLLLSYIKTFEEQEMVERFGAAYEAYRRSTPFLLPRLIRRQEKFRGQA